MYEILVNDEQYVGVCGLTDIDYINSRAEFSLYIGPEYRGRGIAGKALSRLVAHGFDVLNLNSVWGESFAGNPAEKVFKLVGFIKTGVRPAFYYRQGAYVDANLWTIMRGQLRNAYFDSDSLAV